MNETIRRIRHWFRPRPPCNFGELREATRSDVLAIPLSRAPWNEKIVCASFAIVPSRRRHESGWGKMGIVAVLPDGSLTRFQIEADDIYTHRSEGWELGVNGCEPIDNYRFDCLRRSGLIHVWASRCDIEIQARTSTVDFYLKRRVQP